MDNFFLVEIYVLLNIYMQKEILIFKASLETKIDTYNHFQKIKTNALTVYNESANILLILLVN